MSAQKAASWSHSCSRALYVATSGTRWPIPTTNTTPSSADPRLRHRRARGGTHAGSLGSPLAATHRGCDLVERPGVACGDVESGSGHLPSRVDARLIPGRARARDPLLPRRQVDLRERVEGRAERADPRGVAGPLPRLVSGDRRHRDVVLGARRRLGRERRREAQPVPRRVEDRTQGATPAAPRAAKLHPARQPRPEPLRRLRLERRHRLRLRGDRGRRGLGEDGQDRARSEREQREAPDGRPHDPVHRGRVREAR